MLWERTTPYASPAAHPPKTYATTLIVSLKFYYQNKELEYQVENIDIVKSLSFGHQFFNLM